MAAPTLDMAGAGALGSACVTDGDCGEGDCRTYTGEPHGWCFAPCTGPSDCRAGYACFASTIAYCFWSENLNCDPTSKSGTCANAPLSNPGGCIRSALGPGLTGTCNDGCDLSGAACPNSNGVARQCVVFDNTKDKDANGVLYGDTFHGAVCSASYSTNTDGQECLYTPPTGSEYDRLTACGRGDECYLASAFSGDNRCHALCNKDAGDGGVGCAGAETCQDVFGLFASTTPIGLCH